MSTPGKPSNVNGSRPKDVPLLGPVRPKVDLTTKQKSYLDEGIPARARQILENSDKFELLGEIDKDESSESDLGSLLPNRSVVIGTNEEKQRILEAFYFDASREDSPAACYEPHHAIRASYLSETIEIEICFSCSRFVTRLGSEKFSGTIVTEGRRSEDLFEKQFKD